VATDFHKVNGNDDLVFIDPKTANWFGKSVVKYDLIVSYQAWCFHFSPMEYLSFVLSSCKLDTVFIIDVRRDVNWLELIEKHFTIVAVAGEAIKWKRLVLKPKKEFIR